MTTALTMIPLPRSCACIRIAVPYTGMIISTRESQAVPGKGAPSGRFPDQRRLPAPAWAVIANRSRRTTDSAQFDVSDHRTLDEVVRWLMEMGYIPSFCTACYREGRTGDRFMSLCKSGQIQNCCHPNALMTLERISGWTMPPRKPGRSANGSSRGKQETSPASWCMIECSNI